MGKKLGIYYNDSLLGVIGEQSKCIAILGHSDSNTRSNICVGDVIAFYEHKRIYLKVALKDGVFGFGSNRFNFNYITKVVSHEDLTVDMLRKIQSPNNSTCRHSFDIREIEESGPVEMTVKEIEKVLGKKIKIIGD